MMRSKIPVFLFLFLSCYLIASTSRLLAQTASQNASYLRYQEPEFLTFEELKKLSSNPYPQGMLKKKLDRFWVTPIISNEAYYRGVRPIAPLLSRLGKSLVLAQWNIEKSIHMDRVINMLASERALNIMLDRHKTPEGSPLEKRIQEQRKKLLLADVIVLEEIEIGMKRSKFMNAAKELAQALNMNYVYAPQYLEVDPVVLGIENISFEDGSVDHEATAYYKTNPEKFKGVFGSAVLSRYPIKHVQVFPLQNQGYDWYWEEKSKTTFLENFRRFGSKTIFQNELTREMKIGGRHFFRVDLEVPDLPEKTLTVINIHLEIKCLPAAREHQIREILSTIRDIKNPVILAGDFNAAPQDLSPTSMTRIATRSIKDPSNWLTLAINTLSPHALLLNTTRGISNVTKNFQDPTARSVPWIAPNPTKGLFKAVEGFSFSDGGVFDFRGDKNRAAGNDGTLGNSNQRDFKGFKMSFKVTRPLGPWIGKYRLDWIFVKSNLTENPYDRKGPYRFAPHFAETLEELNTSLIRQLSDHHPSVVFLPFEEPHIAD